MPLIGDNTVQQLIDDIKQEGRVKGSDNLNISILSLINECLLAHTETERYSKFLLIDVPITLVAGQGTYELPEDFQNIRTVYWWRDGQPVNARTLREKGDFIERSRDGREPKWYELTADSITVFPYSDVKLTDHLTIDYWKQPDALVETDKFPLAKLYPVIKREVIARLHTFNKDYNAADRFNQSSTTQGERSQTTEDNGDTQ